MADQDFNINIRTLADLTGIKLTQEQLNALQTAAANGNKQAIAALKQLTAAEKEAAQAARQQAQEQVQGIRNASAYGLLIGGFVAKAINDLATAQNKVTKELDEQGRVLVKNVQEWNKLAQSASTPEQLANVGEKAVSQIDALRIKFNEVNGEALSLTDTVKDLIEKFATWTPFQPGSNQALLDERVRAAQQALSDAQENASATIKRGLDQQRDAHEDIDGVIARETDHLKQQQALLRNIDPKTQLQSWVAVEQTIERITKKLAELNAQRQKQVEAGQPTTRAGLLGQQEGQLQDLSHLGQLTPVERERVFQQQIQTHTEKFDQDIKDRTDAFNKSVEDRNKRFTGGTSTGIPLPPGAPLAGPSAPKIESTIQANEGLIQAIKQAFEQSMARYWGP